MRIVFYINVLTYGGAERVIANLANSLSEENEIIVITSYPCNNEYLLKPNIIRINIDAANKKEHFFFRNIRRIIFLRKIIGKYRPDTVISFMAEPNFRTIIASLGLKHKTVISVRNDPKIEYPNLLFRFLAKSLYRFADHIVFQTEEARQWFPSAIQKKSSIILNPINEVFFNTKFYGQRHDIVTTGRLVSQKNHKLLILAFAKISNKINDNLIIYGEGELRLELERLIADLGLQNRVFLPGAVKNVAETIKTAKLFVLSSDYEGLPNSLMEAMALGIPCISTNCPCGGPQMLLNRNFLFKTGDIDALSDLIIKTVKEPCVNNYKISSESISPNVIFDEWKKII